MNRKKKDLEKFKNNPLSLSYNNIESILFEIGFEKIPGKGSHIKMKYKKLDLVFPLHNNDCKDFYKKNTLKILQNNNLI